MLFINAVNGASYSHKTPNIVFVSGSMMPPFNWNVYLGLRDAITIQFPL